MTTKTIHRPFHLGALAAATLSALTLFASTATSYAEERPSGDPDTSDVAAEKRWSVNISPIGFLTGSYTSTFEYLRGAHGIISESSYNHFSDSDSSSNGAGVALGYRWHWRGRQDSGFLGINAGASVGTASTDVGEGDMEREVDVDVFVVALTGNVGRRWAWDNGFNITVRVGAGYGRYDITTESDDAEAQEAVDDIDDLLRRFPIAIDGEVSIGVIF